MASRKKNQNFSLDSYAKINLYLDILERRTDGFHEIRTLFSQIDLKDTLNFTLTKSSTVQILTNYDFVNTEDNIIYKVTLFIKHKYCVDSGVKIELNKEIPVAAGLGGGSSNAAQTIIGLSRIWDLDLSQAELDQIAAEFGSDINFFLTGGTAVGEGRGEIIKKTTDVQINNILLIKPPFGISSKDAYQAFDQDKSDKVKWPDVKRKFDVFQCWNALQKGVCRLYPEVKELIDELGDKGADKVILSGSGPTVIGFCSDKAIADKLAEYYSKKGYWSYVAKTMQRSTI
jgi:4-diphosphocytidyl-2-C-methyl-D-erythritol kinase